MVSECAHVSVITASVLRRTPLLKVFGGVASVGLLAVSLGFLSACSPLEPLDEPEVTDLQLMVDTLKTSVRDAQRSLAELRVEAEARRQELADVRIARAQLEGRVREAERRLVEARHVIDLQRDELAGSRAERERVLRASTTLQNQLKQLQRQIPKMGRQSSDFRDTGAAPASLSSVKGRIVGSAPMSLDQPEGFEEGADASASPPVRLRGTSSSAPVQATSSGMTGSTQILVKPGDTLWSLARQHRMSLQRLKALNQLADNHIEAGQLLRLTE